MATYTITIDNSIVPGLEEVFAQANVRNIQQRQAPFADLSAFITASVIATARQGMSTIIQRHANDIAVAVTANAAAIDPAVLLQAVQAFASAPVATQDAVKTTLGLPV